MVTILWQNYRIKLKSKFIFQIYNDDNEKPELDYFFSRTEQKLA